MCKFGTKRENCMFLLVVEVVVVVAVAVVVVVVVVVEHKAWQATDVDEKVRFLKFCTA